MTTVGVLGGGQLGRMLALAGYPLGLHFRFLDPSSDSPAGQLAERLLGLAARAPLLHRVVHQHQRHDDDADTGEGEVEVVHDGLDSRLRGNDV